MKYFIYIVFAVAIFVFSSCTDNSADLGLSIRPAGDGIEIDTAVFLVNSFNVKADSVSSPSDTLLLGEFYEAKYGTTRGEILAQFTPPGSFQFPAGAVPDSLTLSLVFSSWKGNKNSPIQIKAYEMDKGNIDYNKTYYTNEDPLKYCSLTKQLGSRISVAVPDTLQDTTYYQPHLTYKFTTPEANGDTPAQRFFKAAQNGSFVSQTAFANFFRGVYLRSEYGNGALWNISQIYMQLFYHYHAFINNKDTMLTSGLVFPASKDVRQLSLISHPNRDAVMANTPDNVTYVTSPAGIYTEVDIPVGQILNRALARFKGKIINFNHAGMRVEVTERDTTHTYALKQPSTLMLTYKSNLVNYIKKYNYATDTLMLAAYNSTAHTYSFDLSALLTACLHKKFKDGVVPANYIEKMVLIPVRYTLASSSSSTITSIAQQPTISGVSLRNMKDKDSPLRINIVYNGF